MKGWGRVGEPEKRHVSSSGAVTWWEGDGYLAEVEREFAQAGFSLLIHSTNIY